MQFIQVHHINFKKINMYQKKNLIRNKSNDKCWIFISNLKCYIKLILPQNKKKKLKISFGTKKIYDQIDQIHNFFSLTQIRKILWQALIDVIDVITPLSNSFYLLTPCCVDRKCQLEEKKSHIFVDSVPPMECWRTHVIIV